MNNLHPAKVNNNENKHPFSVNILNLQRFDFKKFKFDEVLLFEYLIITGKHFDFKEFYKSNKVISEETSLKPSRINSIKKRLIDQGFIQTRLQGTPCTTYYTLDLEKIINSLDQIYKPEFVSEIKDNFQKWKSERNIKTGSGKINLYQKFNMREILKILAEDTEHKNNICKKERINDEQLANKLVEFFRERSVSGQNEFTYPDFKNYFGNWLRKKLKHVKENRPAYLKNFST